MTIKTIAALITFYCFSLFNTNTEKSSAPPPMPPGGEFDLSQAILPPSPTAAEFAKYGDIPVDLSSGVPSISVPLYTLPGRGLSVPLSLSYHASGVRVDDVSSMVGMSWSLNSGGVVTRTVRGTPDEFLTGYMHTGNMIPYPFDYPEDLNWLYYYVDGNADADGQPDLFSFNVGGISGKFFFEGDGTIRTIPHQNLKIEFEIHDGSPVGGLVPGAIGEVKITSPDGVVYTFGGEDATELSKTRTVTVGNGNTCNSKSYDDSVPTSWYLKKIYNPNTNDAIDFTYEPHLIFYYLGYNETHNLPTHEGPQGGACTGYTYSKCITIKDDNGVHITEINSSFGKVTFGYNDSTDPNDLRMDIPSTNGKNGVRLEEVKIFGATDSQNPIRRFVLEQDYWQATTGNTPSGNGSDNYRMYLKTVTEYGAGSGAKPPHLFFYNNGDGLPPRLCYDQDHWGFYNGAGNTNLTPEFTGGNGSAGYYTGADRSIDPVKTQYGLLNKIIYPTGGETLFDYFGSYQIESEVEETVPVYINLNRRQFCPAEDGDADDCNDPVEAEELFNLGQTTEVTVFRKEIARTDVAHPGGFTYAKLLYDDGTGGGYVLYPYLEPYNFSTGSAPDDEANGSGDNFDIRQESSTYSLPAGDYKMKVRASQYHHNEATINVSYDAPTGDTITINTDYCGLRVKKIASDGKLLNPDPITVKTYDYEVDDWVLQSVVPIYFREKTTISTIPLLPCAYNVCKNYTVSSSSVNRTNKNGGGNIFYRKVTEGYGENSEFGRSYNEFSFYPDDDPDMGPTGHFPLSGTPGIDNKWKCGHLLHQMQYDANGQVVQETINDYSFIDVNHDYSAKAIVVRKQYDLPCPTTAPQVICDNDITDARFICHKIPCWEALQNNLNNYIDDEANFIAVFHTNYTITNNTLPQAAIDILNDITPIFPCSLTVDRIFDAVTNGEITGTHDLAYIIQEGSGGCYWLQTSACLGAQPGDTITLPGGLDGWAIEYYDVKSSWVKLNSSTSIVDGVTTITDYEYGNPLHLNPTATVVTNSNGLVHRTETKYADEIGNQSMIDKFMHSIPLETKSFVDGTLVGGKLTVYDDFSTAQVDENGNPVVFTLPKTVTQILYNGTPLLRATVLDYDDNGNMTSFTKEPANLYSPITITWQNDLPIKKQFIGWDWDWEYDGNTRRQTKAINIDDIESTYEYDEFQRLTEATSRNGGITDSYSYNLTLAGDPTTPNHIIHSSSATGVTTYQYTDGLGRGKEAVKVAYSPDLMDVATGVSLDAFGRSVSAYLPFLGVSNGAYIDPNGPANTKVYEDSPLSRETARTFAGGGSVSQSYSSNGSSEVKKFDETGTQNGYYDAGKLYKHKVTDENANITATFTDIAGRTILVNQYLNLQAISTYNVYDNRGNLVFVIPPGANTGNDPLSYAYLYDERNRLISKKIPGADLQTFTYNDKDELVTSTDGNGTILTNTYNGYGQLVSTATGGSNLILNTYSGTQGSSKGKIVNTAFALLDDPNNAVLSSSFSYDNLGRVGTTTAQNHIGGNDIITSYYDGGTDRITRTTRNHIGFETLSILQGYDFDHVKRLTDVWHRIDNGDDVRLSNNNYDFKDRLIEKNLGGGQYGRYLQSVDYQYNLRNWLTHINQLGEGGHPVESCDPLPEQETEVFCGDAQISLDDLLRLRREIDDLNIDCYDPCLALNEQIILGDTVNLPGQTSSLITLDNTMTATTTGSITYPTSMYHVKLLNQQERMVLKEELPIIQGGYLTDQCHDVLDSTQNFNLILNTGLASKNLGELLTIRKTETPVFEDPNCEDDTTDPSCGQFSDSFAAHGINSSTLFSAPGPPLTDLSQFPGADNSLVNDGIVWDLNNYTDGEAEWDIRSSINTVQGTTVSSYTASVEITEEIIDEGSYYLGLHDGNGFVKINGGLDYLIGTDTGVIVLTPDTLPTAQQADDMVLAYRLAGNISIDAVWVDINYEVSCDCYVTPPDCELTPEQEAQALQDIVYLEPNQVSFPTKLYRIMLCDGSEMYLLADELATFTGTYIIIQQIDITSPGQTFLADTLGLDRADIFAMRLYYDESNDDGGTTLNGTSQRNGNIANMYWQTKGRNQQIYAFSYDNLNRLTGAAYFDKEGLILTTDNKYGVPSIAYDVRGNITTLNRNGLNADCPSPQYGAIDLLSYSYNTENQLTGLTDAADLTRGFKKPGPGGAYTYDNNGNMTRDPNKGIIIDYNIMNLPKKITFDTGEEIEFLYDAAGTKLKKITRENGNEITKDYAGGIEYVTESFVSTLEAVYHEEGRATPEIDEITKEIVSFNYEYSIRDHLGNSRITFSDIDGNGKIKIGGQESEILQENHYYPFGMNMEGNWVPQIGLKNQYQYNGKELNEDFGLDWYHYGFRMYDAAIGRFTGVDPISDKFPWVSTYNYAENDPVGHIDLHGLQKAGYKINQYEREFKNKYPIKALRIGKDRDSETISGTAKRMASNLYKSAGLKKGDGGRGGPRNAIQHTLWQAMITREFGKDIAVKIGNVHEEKSMDSPPTEVDPSATYATLDDADRAVDFLNNEIGREIGAANENGSNKGLADKVLNEFATNGLWGASETENGFAISKQAISGEQKELASNANKKLDQSGRNEKQRKNEKLRKQRFSRGSRW